MIAQPESSTTEAKQYPPELTITNNYADKSRTLNTSDGPSEQEVSPSETHSFSTEENTTPTTLSNNAQPLKTYATIVNPTDIPLLQEFDISIEDLRFTMQATATTHFTNPSGGADEQQKLASSLIADCNSYTFARSAEDVGGPSTLQFDLESAVRTANDTVSGCFSVGSAQRTVPTPTTAIFPSVVAMAADLCDNKLQQRTVGSNQRPSQRTTIQWKQRNIGLLLQILQREQHTLQVEHS